MVKHCQYKGHCTHKPNVVTVVIMRALDSHPKAVVLNMVCPNLRQAYLLEVGLTSILANHETLFIVCHVGIHVDFSSRTTYLGF
jgi:hypothetical protein